ncbi:uncharacterized protein DUF1302 [Zavarzinia compransoris]|uniref:DUF1302 domain-containing protein n=2 Tax=Zavarzinia compransoris TaxID=1264899 RepID=A0A317E0C8_9PROT|nr:hypothetical protein DKG75_10995 [Zavarzinia compransoris]TDP43828.1 uncharacterized protein DUF1302 [Zavarzinia compransoris]
MRIARNSARAGAVAPRSTRNHHHLDRRCTGSRRWGRGLAMATAAAALVAGLGATAWALEFDVTDEISGSLIVSLSTGAQFRMADRDPRNYGYYYGGKLISAGNDDGNFNFDKYDAISQITTASAELSLKWQNYFMFTRGVAFYDSIAARNELADFQPELRPYTSGRYPEGADNKADWDAKILDYYIGANFSVFDRNLNVKIGSQILNWGEALFTINGISVINPIDVGKIRTPGAELKDALIPVPMVVLGYELASGLSIEGFYQLDFEPYKLDACGSFFSFTDNFCDGVKYASSFTDPMDPRSYTTETGLNPQDYDDPNSTMIAINAPLKQNDDPDVNDWGVALRYFVPELNNTEFQLYYINYTSRLPSLRATAPQQYAPGTGELNLVSLAPNLVDGLLDTVAQGQLDALGSALAGLLGGPIGNLAGALTGPLTSQLIDPPYGTAPRSTVITNLENGEIEMYYPSGIDMIGFAFNTTYDPLGVAINAEISYKHDAPVWISEPAFLAGVYDGGGGVPIDQATKAPTPLGVQNPGIAPLLDTSFQSFDNEFRPGRQLTLDLRHDVWQAAIRFTQIRGGTDWLTSLLGANQLFALVEFGALYIDLKDGFQYASYGQNGFSGFQTRSLSIGPADILPPIQAPSLGPMFPETGKQPTRWSGGVQGLFFWDYPNIFTGVTMTPSIGFSHGLFGITPAPNPGFTKSVTSMNFGLKFEYLSQWSVNVNYFKSWGGGGGTGGARNPYIDRDFVGFSVSYIF